MVVRANRERIKNKQWRGFFLSRKCGHVWTTFAIRKTKAKSYFFRIFKLHIFGSA